MNESATPDTEPAIRIERLSYAFKQHLAVNNISFEVPRGSIHGFVGPNGAGKTTTLRVLATLLRPRTGTVRVLGLDVVSRVREVRRRIGFMPDHFSMYRQMTVFEYLDFFGAAYGLNLQQRDKIIGDVLALTDMSGRRNDLIKGLSRGMQQRVSLARVLVHDPDLLLLDEPASGLDPRARIELMDILRELKRMGKTIFISSHILSELADLCDSCTILDRGEVKYTGSMRALLHDEGDVRTYLLRLEHEPLPDLSERLAALTGMQAVQPGEEPNTLRLTLDVRTLRPNDVLVAVLEAGASVEAFHPERKHLNQAFMDLTEAGVRT